MSQTKVCVPKADIIVELTYDIKNPENRVIRTNAKKRAISEILEGWLSCQLGKGKDNRDPEQKPVYKIVIKLDLSDDTYYTTSDTGNKGLTLGVVMNVFVNLDEIRVEELS